MDNLVICKRCGSDACYKQEVNADINNFVCYGCGFISNSLMKEGQEYWETQLELLPELHKDLVFEDKDGQYWIPNTINQHKQGMVFANGKNIEEWKWTAVKAIQVDEQSKEKFPIPGKPGEYYEWRMDMDNMVDFEEKDYMDALSYIGILP
jgi:hypothetical protein